MLEFRIQIARQFILAVLVLLSFTCPSNCQAGLVVFSVSGTADVTLDGTFLSGQDFQITFAVDDSEPDQMPFDSSRGAFRNVNVMLSLADPGLMIDDRVAININGLRQDKNPESMFLVNDSNFFNQGFSIGLPVGTLGDVNSIAPLGSSDISARWSGAGLAWNLQGGQTLVFNQVSSMAISNQSVPEPPLLLSFIFCSAGIWYRRPKRLQQS